MTPIKTLMTSASIAALLAAPVAAQNTDANPNLGTNPTTEENVSTESNLEAQSNDNLDMTGETSAEATAPGADMPSTELDFGYSTNVAMAIAGAKLDPNSTLVGYNVLTREGQQLGDVSKVYTVEGKDSYLVVNLDERLNIAADAFLIRLGAAQMQDTNLVLSTTEVEFTNALKKSAGIETIEAN